MNYGGYFNTLTNELSRNQQLRDHPPIVFSLKKPGRQFCLGCHEYKASASKKHVASWRCAECLAK